MNCFAKPATVSSCLPALRYCFTRAWLFRSRVQSLDLRSHLVDSHFTSINPPIRQSHPLNVLLIILSKQCFLLPSTSWPPLLPLYPPSSPHLFPPAPPPLPPLSLCLPAKRLRPGRVDPSKKDNPRKNENGPLAIERFRGGRIGSRLDCIAVQKR